MQLKPNSFSETPPVNSQIRDKSQNGYRNIAVNRKLLKAQLGVFLQ